jgi:hypothetical protein
MTEIGHVGAGPAAMHERVDTASQAEWLASCSTYRTLPRPMGQPGYLQYITTA